jgi:hypothetical protein
VRRARSLALLLVATACGAYSADEERAPAPDAGTSNDAGADQSAGPRCSPPVRYASSRGDDVNDGCDPTKPKRTIASALAAVHDLAGGEVRVCAETFRERVVLTSHASLVGGFDCVTWMPGTERTTIEPPAEATETLTAESAAVDATAKVGRVRIVGAKVVSGNVVVVRLSNGASPSFGDVEVVGGSTDEGDAIGLLVDGAQASFADVTVSAGAGRCTANCAGRVPARGIVVKGGAPRMQRVRVSGGNGQIVPSGGDFASIALDVSGAVTRTGSDAFTMLEIVGGDATVGGASGAVGMRVSAGATIEIADSKVVPGVTGSICSQAPCRSYAVFASAGTARIVRSRVVAFPAKAVPPASGPILTESIALKATSGRVDVFSSFVHGADIAIDGAAKSTIDVKGTTVVGGWRMVFQNEGSTFAFASSILAHPANSYVGWLSACQGTATTTAFESSTFVGNALPFFAAFPKTSCSSGASYGSMSGSIGASADNVVTATSVLRVTGECLEDQAKVKCRVVTACGPSGSGSMPAECMRDLFEKWTAADNGRTELLGAEGLRLKAGAPCLVAKGGKPFPEIATDAFASTRTEPISMGAHEQDACTP